MLRWRLRRPEAPEVHAEVDQMQALRRHAPADQRAAHPFGVDEDRVGDDLLGPAGEEDVRPPRRGDHRAVGDLGRDPAPAREPVRLDEVGPEAVEHVAQPVLLGLAGVVDRELPRDIVERDRAAPGLGMARDEHGAAERRGMLRPALGVPDVERAELEHAQAGGGDQQC